MVAGIPVICLESGVAEPNYTTLIKCDNHAIGKRGRIHRQALKNKYGSPRGNVVQIKGCRFAERKRVVTMARWRSTSIYPEIQIVHEAVADGMQDKRRRHDRR